MSLGIIVNLTGQSSFGINAFKLEGVTIEPLTPEDHTGIVLPRPATGVREFKGVYDLSGRTVADDPLKPGIYIRDGKKHVSK